MCFSLILEGMFFAKGYICYSVAALDEDSTSETLGEDEQSCLRAGFFELL
jgi:hypothetical protein